MPSTRDAHHDPCFPQPPFSSAVMPAPGLTLAPNPCTIRVNDCVIGVCAGMLEYCVQMQPRWFLCDRNTFRHVSFFRVAQRTFCSTCPRISSRARLRIVSHRPICSSSRYSCAFIATHASTSERESDEEQNRGINQSPLLFIIDWRKPARTRISSPSTRSTRLMMECPSISPLRPACT